MIGVNLSFNTYITAMNFDIMTVNPLYHELRTAKIPLALTDLSEGRSFYTYNQTTHRLNNSSGFINSQRKTHI